ncbi:MAG: 4Fe-4S binding protein [Cellulomonas sp.]
MLCGGHSGIRPDECVDCRACEPVCPVEAHRPRVSR